jgi:hypothetical protein
MHVPQYSAKMPTTKATFRLPALFDVVVPVSRRPCIRAFLITSFRHPRNCKK